jgi:PilZ domain
MDERTKTDPNVPSQRPRSPRVPVNFTVELEGAGEDARDFHVTAEAVRVSRGGATLVADIELAVGTRVRLTPPFGRTLDAEVNGIWTDEADGRQRIGVKLLDPAGWFAE